MLAVHEHDDQRRHLPTHKRLPSCCELPATSHPLNGGISLNFETSINIHDSSSCCLACVGPRRSFWSAGHFWQASFRHVTSLAGKRPNLERLFVQRPHIIHGKLNVAFESVYHNNKTRISRFQVVAGHVQRTQAHRKQAETNESLHIARIAQNVMQHARRVSP